MANRSVLNSSACHCESPTNQQVNQHCTGKSGTTCTLTMPKKESRQFGYTRLPLLLQTSCCSSSGHAAGDELSQLSAGPQVIG
jgi:hypothetical protein